MRKTALFPVLALTLAACGNNEPKEEKTSEEGVSKEVTTEAPTTEAPTTESPTTEAPTTEAPKPKTAPSYPVTSKDDYAHIELPSIKNAEFADQILSNTFNIDGIQVNKSSDIESVLGTPKDTGYDSEMVYDNFSIEQSGDTVTKIFLDVSDQNINVDELKNAWGKDFEDKQFGGFWQSIVLYDGDRTNNYHIEVGHSGEMVHSIAIYQGDTRETTISPKVNPLSSNFIETFNKTPHQNIAGIYKGMSRQELLKKFGYPDGELPGEGGSTPMYGDVVVGIGDTVNRVSVTKEGLTVDDIISRWGEPTEDDSEVIGPGYARLIYDANPNNGYSIVVFYTENHVVEIMKADDDGGNFR